MQRQVALHCKIDGRKEGQETEAAKTAKGAAEASAMGFIEKEAETLFTPANPTSRSQSPLLYAASSGAAAACINPPALVCKTSADGTSSTATLVETAPLPWQAVASHWAMINADQSVSTNNSWQSSPAPAATGLVAVGSEWETAGDLCLFSAPSSSLSPPDTPGILDSVEAAPSQVAIATEEDA